MTDIVRIGQAIYGERDRGHHLLGASPATVNAGSIAARMDLRGSPPPHFEWRPYFSGFPDGDRYVLAWTTPDPTAPRLGMVFSRALLIPQVLTAAKPDISGMLSLLEELGQTREAVDDVEWRDGTAPTGNVELARALVEGGKSPVVWPGTEGFSHAIAGLWRNLWPAARSRLSFRLAFTPQDVTSDPPDIVCVPKELLSRWSGAKTAKADGKDGSVSANSLAVVLLAGGAGPAGLRDLVEDLASGGAGLESAARLAEVASVANDGRDLPDLIDAMRLAARLAPDPAHGTIVKRALIKKAAGAMGDASAAELRMARNLNLSSFQDAAAFWLSMKQWAREKLWNEVDDCALAATLKDGLSSEAMPAWRGAVTGGAGEALAKPSDVVVAGVWRVLRQEPSLLLGLASERRASVLDRPLALAVPDTLDAAVAEVLLDGTSSLGMALSNAATCAASLPPVQAIIRHLDGFEGTVESIGLASARATPAQVVSAALRHDHPVMQAVASEAAAADISLLCALDPAMPGWRTLWSSTLQLNLDAWEGPANPQRASELLLDYVADGLEADQLLDKLCRTPLANVLTHPRRAELWHRLPETARGGFLDATTNAWIAEVEAGRDAGPIEPPLADTVASPDRLDSLLGRLVRDPAAGCAVFRALPRLDERAFVAWLARLVNDAPAASEEGAAAIGRLAASRSWNDAAHQIARAVLDRGRNDFRPALSFIKDMLGFFTSWALDVLGEHPSSEAKWRILEDVACDLYGYGPGDQGLWTRAGGKEADIPKATTGRDGWRIVIAAAEYGKGRVDVDRLIEVMRDDHPNHWALDKMRKDPLFRRSR